MALPISIGINPRNIKVSEGSEADLERGLRDAFTELAKDFRAYVGKLEDYLPEDLKEALEPTFEKSQEIVPVNTGDLKASGYLEVEQFRGGARVEIGYGRNGFPPYAVAVHEIPAFHQPLTRDKFLQGPIEEDYFDIIMRVTERVKARSGAF